MSWEFEAEVFAWDAEGPSWRFARVPGDVADDLHARGAASRSGTVRVEATIGRTVWKTSLFPEKATENYLLAVKAAVRKAEGIHDGDVVSVRLTLVN